MGSHDGRSSGCDMMELEPRTSSAVRAAGRLDQCGMLCGNGELIIPAKLLQHCVRDSPVRFPCKIPYFTRLASCKLRNSALKMHRSTLMACNAVLGASYPPRGSCSISIETTNGCVRLASYEANPSVSHPVTWL